MLDGENEMTAEEFLASLAEGCPIRKENIDKE